MTDNSPSNLPVEQEENSLISSVDMITRARAGSLSAHGLTGPQIADILLLSIEQISAIKDTVEFKKKYAEEAEKAIQAQIDRDEGWDAVEDEALGALLETLKFNRDPKFALIAAKTANSAVRQNKKHNAPHVIDNSKGGSTNIIVLNLNRNYVGGEAGRAQIELNARPTNIPQRQSDLPSPKIVEAMLAPVKENAAKPMNDLERMFRDAGVVFDGNNDE